MLELIFKDLSSRGCSGTIRKETFLSYFHLNGLWGERVFRLFGGETELSKTQFVQGMSDLVKTDKHERVRQLFSLYQRKEGGVSYTELLRLLYNYPKKELKEIMNNEEFIDREILRGTTEYLPAFEGLLSYKNEIGTNFNFDKGKSRVEVKRVSMSQLVHRFASSVFKEIGLNPEADAISYPQFEQLITKHPKLYHTYFSGFHNEVWECKGSNPLCHFLPAEFESNAILLEPERSDIRMRLFHTTLLLYEEGIVLPRYVICLEGLNVSTKQKGEKALIEITHCENCYKKKLLELQSRHLRDEWMVFLQEFKGGHIQNNFSIEEKIGVGNHSIIYKGVKKNDSQVCAIKVQEIQRLSKAELAMVTNEADLLKRLNHSGLVQVSDCYRTKSHLYSVMEYVEGCDLFELIVGRGPLSEQKSRVLFGQMVELTKYVHEQGFVVRDIKPQMFLVCKDLTWLKAKDFPYAIELLGKESYCEKEDRLVGTPNFVPPETLRSMRYNQKSDVFALGAVLYYMLYGELPFDHDAPDMVNERTMADEPEYSKDQTISEEAIQLMQSLLAKSPEDRPSCREALTHQWFRCK